MCDIKIALLLFLLPSTVLPDEVSALKIGNFALPPSQQPGPLFGFGQNIIDEKDVLGSDELVVRKFQKDHILTNDVSLLYGISDRASIFASIYLPVNHKSGNNKSTGIGDTTIQAEYAYIKKEYFDHVIEATAVGSITFPTGSIKKNPPTGFGAMSYFIGGTFFYIDPDWYIFSSVGNLFITKHHERKFGDILYYQAGIGHNLKHMKNRILILFLEFDGYRFNRDEDRNKIVPNTGSNIIFLGPSLFYSTPRWSCELGMQAPIYEKDIGQQKKASWWFAFRFNWLFYHEHGGDQLK